MKSVEEINKLISHQNIYKFLNSSIEKYNLDGLEKINLPFELYSVFKAFNDPNNLYIYVGNKDNNLYFIKYMLYTHDRNDSRFLFPGVFSDCFIFTKYKISSGIIDNSIVYLNEGTTFKGYKLLITPLYFRKMVNTDQFEQQLKEDYANSRNIN